MGFESTKEGYKPSEGFYNVPYFSFESTKEGYKPSRFSHLEELREGFESTKEGYKLGENVAGIVSLALEFRINQRGI